MLAVGDRVVITNKEYLSIGGHIMRKIYPFVNGEELTILDFDYYNQLVVDKKDEYGRYMTLPRAGNCWSKIV